MIRFTLEVNSGFELSKEIIFTSEGVAVSGLDFKRIKNEVIGYRNGVEVLRTEGGKRLSIQGHEFKLPRFSFKRELHGNKNSVLDIFKWTRNKIYKEPGLREAWDICIGQYKMLVVDLSYSRSRLTAVSVLTESSVLEEDEIYYCLGVLCYFWAFTDFDNNY